MSVEEREKRGISTLPENLYEAIELAEKSELVKKTLGEHTFTKLIENKTIEWHKYRTQVTAYELEEYLPVL
jgi:glutamine synthetase